MFRKPRDSHTVSDVGRPPSPKPHPAKTPFSLARPPAVPVPTTMAAAKTRSSNKSTPLPTIGRQGPAGSAKKSLTSVKAKDKGNGNILSFFKREDVGLFVPEGGEQIPVVEEVTDGPGERFNEDESPSKRIRLSEDADVCASVTIPPVADQPETITRTASAGRSGPFMEDSDAEDEEEASQESIVPVKIEQEDEAAPAQAKTSSGQDDPMPPPLLKQETSCLAGLDDFRDFEGIEDDFDEDLYEDGDEYMERQYMEEQARIEEMEAQNGVDNTDGTSAATDGKATTSSDAVASACPVCDASLDGTTEQDAAVHVNNCLDGKPTPLKRSASPIAKIKSESSSSPNPQQFRRPFRAPRPGQQNPFVLGETSTSGGSAFNKLMSGHAEDAAWAEAAASEHAARGKPFYQRTCPFYKILPGLYICVDAFRYGAVAGCRAYFLSHFHSDHYVGLTSNWNHGPIYCSRVTGNLVRQQLRVDPKYVVDLDFEKPTEVPGTKGVQVTMISANHCPGSSLYLFEKVVGKKTNGEPRLQRVLHCGDFRACKMHIQHPLLMPEVRDRITGKSKEQKIDVCYLDTTYLNPKYAFPSQELVIKACADMCVSLAKITPDDTDGWEQMKRQRAGEGMVKFVRRESSGIDTNEDSANDEIAATDMKLEAHINASQQIISSDHSQKTRGRLLVIVGTYSIGKERICLGIAKALDSKIYAPTSKRRIVDALEDPELNARMTSDPRAAQVHMTPLFEIRADTLDDYLKDYFPHFTRAVGFRPSGWNYRPPNSRFTDSPSVQTVLHSDNWKSSYSMRDLVPQRGSSSRASCFGVPYSEHSSFRELTMFCCALRIDKVIPTVNVGSAKGRERMKAWIERWQTERRKNGLFLLPEDGSW